MSALPPFDANTPDGMLVAASLAGDEGAFAQLVSRYQPALLRAAVSRLGQRQLAEDAVQETFLCTHRWLRTYDSRWSFRTWLWTILLNQCSRLAKQEVRQATNEHRCPAAEATARCGPERSPLDQLLAREDSDCLNQLLARLPAVQADALRLRFFGGLTFPEIAAAMHSSEPGAKLRVKNGLLTLAMWLKDTHSEDVGGRVASPVNGRDSR